MSDYEDLARAAELEGQAEALRIRAHEKAQEAKRILGTDHESVQRRLEQDRKSRPAYKQCSHAGCNGDASHNAGGNGNICYDHDYGRC